MKTSLFVIALCSLLFAQTAYNDREYNFAISGFVGDTLRKTNKFPAGDCEGVSVTVRFPYDIDSAAFVLGYQRGKTIDGVVRYEPWSALCTLNTASTSYLPADSCMNPNDNGDTNMVYIDSVSLSPNYQVLSYTWIPWRSQYARFVVKGLAGNKHTAYNVFFTIHQPRYIRVDTGTGKQPEGGG